MALELKSGDKHILSKMMQKPKPAEVYVAFSLWVFWRKLNVFNQQNMVSYFTFSLIPQNTWLFSQ